MKTITSLTEITKITNGDHKMIKELLGVFITEAAIQIKNLKSQGEKGDWEGLKRTAHKVKSSLMIVGMGAYRHIAEDLETNAGSDPKKTKQLLKKLTEIYVEGLAELKTSLKALS